MKKWKKRCVNCVWKSIYSVAVGCYTYVAIGCNSGRVKVRLERMRNNNWSESCGWMNLNDMIRTYLDWMGGMNGMICQDGTKKDEWMNETLVQMHFDVWMVTMNGLYTSCRYDFKNVHYVWRGNYYSNDKYILYILLKL